jgi:hypothetical protein
MCSKVQIEQNIDNIQMYKLDQRLLAEIPADFWWRALKTLRSLTGGLQV